MAERAQSRGKAFANIAEKFTSVLKLISEVSRASEDPPKRMARPSSAVRPSLHQELRGESCVHSRGEEKIVRTSKRSRNVRQRCGKLAPLDFKLERSPSELNRGRDSRIGFDLLEDCRRAKEAAGMALSDDLRERVVGAVVEGGMSRNAAAKRFGVSIASAVRWVARFKAKGEISPAPTGGDRRSGRIEAHRDYLLGLIRRRPDMTLLEIQERLIANCGERFSSSVLWRFFDRHELTFKKSPRTPRSSNARTF